MAERMARAHSGDLLRFLTSRLRCPEDARDLSQEVLVRLVRTQPQEVDEPLAYLVTCAKSVLAEHYANAGPRTVQLEEAQEAGEIHASGSSILDEEVEQDFLTAVQRLPAGTQRDVFIDIVANRKSPAQVAEERGLAIKTVRIYFSRASIQIKSILQGQGEHDHE